ncbi:GIY-YIG nuclease family protein [Vibrio vulnificus]|uniref:GIY-YIG nuclease family protein n=1 Tax=Vibrio vulnificus TaxID=672 RepID=UPI0028B656BC|nr:GIY-YIG nuclease family protein [Vibrio vulnificus]HDY8238930.1 GIY-YIG nuclease family protein [Vibrio vulnificus]
MSNKNNVIGEAIRGHKYKCDHVYVAYSPSTDLFKIGISSAPRNRITSIRASGVGGVKDWEFHCVYKVGAIRAFNVEKEVARQLRHYNVHAKYLKHCHTEYSTELYQCDIKLIKAAFKTMDVLVPINSDILRKKFVEFVPQMNFLKWINLNRKNVGLSPISLMQLKRSAFFTIPKSANFE